MPKEHITPPDNPRPTGYTHAVKSGPGALLFISGQSGMDAERRLVRPGDIEAQTEQALDNIGRLLQAAGAAWADVVRLNIYLTDIRLLPKVREVRAAYYERVGIPPPATTTAGVTGLSAEGALIEIEATAVLEEAADEGRARRVSPGRT